MEGPVRETEKTEQGGCKVQGVGNKTARGTLGFEVRWAWAGVGLLSRNSQNIFILQNKFGKLFLKTETTVSVKIFSDNFRKIK